MRTVFGIAAALLASTSAFAQTAPVQPAPAPAATDEAPGDIVVTASKREQSLQDVSIAVSAVGADRLATAQVNNLQDLQTIVPSVNFGSDFNQAKIFIRGVGANTSTTGSSTGVALHVDGAYVARAEAQLTSLFDLERVEVLRGPQGTLYGRNAVGGSVNLITAKPTTELSGYGRLTYGNYNQLVAEGAISGEIITGVRARLAVKTENRDGFGRNPVTGGDIDGLNRRMGRVQLDFDLGPRSTLLLSGEYFRQNDTSGAIHYLRASFPGVARLAPLGVGGYATNPRDLASESYVGTDSESYAFTGTYHVDLSDSIGITNIANYRRFKTSLIQDLDLSAVVDALTTNGQATTIQERRIDSKQWSNELQLNVNTEFVKGVVGFYYFDERQHPRDTVGLQARNGLPGNIPLLQAAGVLDQAYFNCGYNPGTVTGGGVIAPKRVCARSNLNTQAYALFGQMNVSLGMLSESLDGVSIKIGGRYSDEHVSSENPSTIVARNGLGPVLVNTEASTHTERTFRNFSPEAGIEWKPNRDLLFYYTYSQGFKAGSGENAAGSTTIVNPENIQNHELGAKATFGRLLSANLALYSYNLQGLQLNRTISGGPAGFSTIFQNAAATSAKGVEFEVFTRPAEGFRLNAAVSYTDAHYVDYVTLDPLNPANILTAGSPAYNAVTNPDPTAFGAPGGGNIQLAGNDTRNSPRWSWNVHGEYDIDAPTLNGKFTLNGDVSYKGQTYFTEYQRAIEGSRAFTMVDSSLNYVSYNKKFHAQVFVKNMFDVLRPSSTFSLATGRLIGQTLLPPRTFGVAFGYNF
ncbi:MAG: TonB-dependent receptor [Sphingomonas sp. 28-66-16]|nr:MAG: TonB-dependent receptor [Sphingomonas sp. 28-66-16]